MEPEHIMEKELILNDEEHEKFDYNKGLKVLEFEPFLQHYSQSLYPLQNLFQIQKIGSNLLKIDNITVLQNFRSKNVI